MTSPPAAAAMQVRIEVDGEPFDLAITRVGDGRLRIEVEGASIDVVLDPNGAGVAAVADGRRFHVQHRRDGEASLDGETVAYRVLAARTGAAAGASASGPLRLRPPMSGRLERLLVRPGDRVEAGQVLFVLEAMKMHNEVRAPVAGRVTGGHAATGSAVEPSRPVLDLEPAPAGQG